MKQIAPLLSLILALTPLVLTPSAASAKGLKLNINTDGSVQIALGDDRRDRRNSDNDRRHQGDNGNRQSNWRDDRGSDNNGGARDNRIDRARQIASSRGRVLDSGPEGGSIFWVKVETGHGKVTFLVDAASGRIIGEK